MTFVASAVTGRGAADSLQAFCRARIEAGEVQFVRHGAMAAAWSADCRWIDTHDDGDVLTVLDGRVHDLAPDGQAKLLLGRYREHGLDVAVDLLGDFVVIVLDRAAGSLLVARDPVGVRPWYLAADGRLHAGASDLATLTAFPWVDTEVNERIAIEYLGAVFQSRGETLYQGIHTLRPGMTWYHDGTRASTIEHHRWQLRPELDVSWDAAADRCRAVLDEVVRDRLAVSGPPTSHVSGGLDSSSVAGTVALLGYRDLAVGRLLFDGPRADEREFSDAVIQHWEVPAFSAPPWIPTEEELWDLTRKLRRPPPDPHFLMFSRLHQDLLAAGRPDGLTGLGGDDAFVASSVGSRFTSSIRLRQGTVLGQIAPWAVRHPRQAWPQLVRPTLHHLAWWKGGPHPFWVSPAAAKTADLHSLLRSRPAKVTNVAAIDERFANFTCGYDASIQEAQAVLGDLAGRRDSHPFLDPRFVTATYGLDPWWPIRGGHSRAFQIAAFGERLPRLVAERRSKADFSEIFWPQVLRDHILEQVRSGPLRALGWLDLEGFNSLVANAKEGKANAAIPLSRCVWLDRWMRLQ